MGKPTCSDDEFISLFRQHGASETARILNNDVRSVNYRRRRLEKIHSVSISSPNVATAIRSEDYPKRLGLNIPDGSIVVGSDAHYWPGETSPGHRGLLKLIEALKPRAVILNGDVHDGARTSRHPPIGWANPPTLIQELRAVEDRTEEIRKAAKGAELLWTLGNHDMRFENRLAANAQEFREVQGFQLRDHFPHWKFAISVWVNGDVVVKHRFKGGIHATHNNTLWAGKTMLTGHLHSLKVTPFSDYNGTRYGVDTGTLADPYGEQFDYSEDSPKNHRSGFIVLTFAQGKLLWPEIAAVVDENHVQFRGQIIAV